MIMSTGQTDKILKNEHYKPSRAKMKNGEYESVEQIDADLNLMFENAKRYNMPNSSIYKRAFRLQQIMQVSTTALYYIPE